MAAQSDNFSVVHGGPLYQMYRRAHLTGEALDLVTRRQIVVSLFAWLPLLVLSVVEGHAWNGVEQPFLLDIDVHARLLVALPLLIFAELHVHRRMRTVVRQFVERELITADARPAFEAAAARAQHLSNSPRVEILLLALVYAVGVAVIWRYVTALETDSWYRLWSGGAPHVTLAGWWYGLVSLPLFQFLLFRWYYRLGLWAWFLWVVTRIGLKLVPVHPDMAGGLGFVGTFSYAFIPLLLAHGTLFAGVIASGIFFDDRALTDYWRELIAFPAFALVFAMGPLLVFVPTLLRLKRAGLGEYGTFAQLYVRSFHDKWIQQKASADEPVLGSPDIQSLADLGHSYQTIVGLRLVPISWNTALQLAVITLLPIAPLTLTMIPAREMAARLVKWIF